MKRLVLLAIWSISLAAISQTNSKKELARLIKTRVMLKDTTTVKTIARRYEQSQTISDYAEDSYTKYLEPTYFNEFKHQIATLASAKDAFVFPQFSTLDLKEQLSLKEIAANLISMDSTMQVDPMTGEGIYVFVQSSKITSIVAIDFYETWYYDEKTMAIEKEVLAYQLLTEVYDYSGVRPYYYKGIFLIVKNEEARQKLVQLNFNR